MEEVASLESRLTGSNSIAHLNEISRLYEICECGELEVVAEALQAIPRVVAHHRLLSSTGEGAKAIEEWLDKHHEAYHMALLQLAASENPRAQVCSIRLAMAAVREEGGSRSSKPREMHIHNLITELLLAQKWGDHTVECLANEFASFVDMRHYILSHLRTCCRQAGQVGAHAGDCDKKENLPAAKRRRHSAPLVESMRKRGITIEDFFGRVLSILQKVAPPEIGKPSDADGAEELHDSMADKMWMHTGKPVGFFLRGYRRVFQDTWLALLSLPVPIDLCKPVLQLVPDQVMPHLSEPLMLADFYLRAFHGGTTEISVLSLSGLFLLLTRHNLGDPETLSSSSGEYYAQLYSLLKPETFKLRKRAKFQRLLSVSLASGLLPARFAAVFAKQCMRVAVSCAEPGTVMWLIAVAYGLIQKHHSHCKYLLHHQASKEDTDKETKETTSATGDCFDGSASMSKALEQVPRTSLWELRLLQRHHVPAVATLAKLFFRPFFKVTSKKLDADSFLDQSVAKLYQQALKSADRQKKKWEARGGQCPLAFKIEDKPTALRVAGWAAALSTSQRKAGANV